MYHDAMVPVSTFDMVIDNPAYDYTLFSTPEHVSGNEDYMIGLNVSTLIKDGGTLQIGIGSLGDAIAYSIILRHTQNDVLPGQLMLTWASGKKRRPGQPHRRPGPSRKACTARRRCSSMAFWSSTRGHPAPQGVRPCGFSACSTMVASPSRSHRPCSKTWWFLKPSARLTQAWTWRFPAAYGIFKPDMRWSRRAADGDGHDMIPTWPTKPSLTDIAEHCLGTTFKAAS
jgi:hypothetical protein